MGPLQFGVPLVGRGGPIFEGGKDGKLMGAEAALEALSDTPALRVTIDHALCPYDMQSSAGVIRWRDAVRRMADRPNTFVKLSGFGMYDAGWTDSDWAPSCVALLLESFGADRVMWGSNYPVESLATPYEDAVLAVASWVPIPDREQVFLRSASDAYSLHLT